MVGKKRYQPFFERLHRLSLRGMHVGEGAGLKGTGEQLVLKYVREKTKNEKQVTIFDVGAMHGGYTKMASQVFGKAARIFAFEPSKAAFSTLKVTSGDIDNLQILNFGFGDRNSSITLYSDPERPGLSSVYNRNLDHFGKSLSDKEVVELKTIDQFCKTEKIEKIHFLKLDVEGHELKALQGASEMLNSGKIRFIQFEFGGCNIDSKTYFQDFFYLLKDNYRISRIVKDGLFEIKNYQESYETFKTTNFFAEYKMKQKIINIAIVVRDYDEAIKYYTETLNFNLVEDTSIAPGKRFVRVLPPGDSETSLLLAKASGKEQAAAIGNQTGGRVFLFLHTDDFWRDYEDYKSKGVEFVDTPRDEVYGIVAVFKDLYGNKWDLIQPK